MKTSLLFASFLALLALMPVSASASLGPGLYDLKVKNGVFHQLCLHSDLSWTSDVAGLGGHWLNTRTNTNIFGTYVGRSNYGNVSVVVDREERW
jgi:hypothetical protein